MRRRAVAALCAHKQEGLQQLKSDPDEMLRGMRLSPSAALPCSLCFMQYTAANLHNILPLFAVGASCSTHNIVHLFAVGTATVVLHLQVIQPQQTQH